MTDPIFVLINVLRKRYWRCVYEPTSRKKNWLIDWLFDWLIDWLIVWRFNITSVISRQHRTYPYFPGFLFYISATYNILSKPMAAFPHNHRRNNGQQWERNRYDYHLSSERILVEPINRTSDLLFAVDWATQIRHERKKKSPMKIFCFGKMRQCWLPAFFFFLFRQYFVLF